MTNAPEWMIYAAFVLSVLNTVAIIIKLILDAKRDKAYITLDSRTGAPAGEIKHRYAHYVTFTIHAGERTINVNKIIIYYDRILRPEEYQLEPNFEPFNLERLTNKTYTVHVFGDEEDIFTITVHYDGNKIMRSSLFKPSKMSQIPRK